MPSGEGSRESVVLGTRVAVAGEQVVVGTPGTAEEQGEASQGCRECHHLQQQRMQLQQEQMEEIELLQRQTTSGAERGSEATLFALATAVATTLAVRAL